MIDFAHIWTTDRTLPLKGRFSEAMKYALNTMDVIKDAWSVQRIAPIECLTSCYIIKGGNPELVLNWRREDSVMVGTVLCITVGDDDEAVTFDEQEKEPGVSFAVYSYEDFPSLFDSANPTVFHLFHVGVNGAQQGMRSPATRYTVECPQNVHEKVQEIKRDKQEAGLRAQIVRARAELKRAREEAAGDWGCNRSTKCQRYSSSWDATPPWRRYSWKAASSWQPSWKSSQSWKPSWKKW
jgi:hypothetical protein